MEDLLNQIIESIREVRTDVQEIRQAQIEQGTQLETLIGNGQPGRISKIEDRVEGLQAAHNKAKGAMYVLGSLWVAVEAMFHVLTR